MSFNINVYNPDTEKVVPKGAVVLDLHEANPAGDPEVVVTNLLKCLRKGTLVCNGVADQIEKQVRPPKPAPKFELGDKVRYVDTENGNGAWARRRWEKHLGIVVKEWSDGSYKVFDTVENDWWVADAEHLAPYED